MVTFVPPYMGEEIKSNAERKMYDILQGLELEDAYVLHSLGLPRHRSKIYGEIDFVVVCRRGVACLEIKGGRVACRDGKWIFTDRYGVDHEKAEGPFAQVTGNMFSLRDVLRQRFAGELHLKSIFVACGVVFPDIAFRSASQEIIPEIIFDSETNDITAYINGIFAYWEARQNRKPDRLFPEDVRKIVDYLRGDFTFIPMLKERLDSIEQRLVRLTNEQAQVLRALDGNARLLIEGGAGTGKTLLAAAYADRKASEGERVLYLTFNKNLANDINGRVKQSDNLKVINIHALFGEYISVDKEELRQNPQRYFSDTLPEAFLDYVSGLQTEELNGLQYDLLVMDEGQDILRPVYLCSLDTLLKGGLAQGRWAVFYDGKQNIYNDEYAEGLEMIESYDNARFRLYVNCRNTVQIGTFSARESGVEISEYLQENGEEVRRIGYNSAEDLGRQIRNILRELCAERIDTSEIVFLAPKKYGNSLLKEAGIEVNELGDSFDPHSSLPRFATIQGFKGLDAKIVILLDLEDIRAEHFSRFIYIAGTRARTLLYVAASAQYWASHTEPSAAMKVSAFP